MRNRKHIKEKINEDFHLADELALDEFDLYFRNFDINSIPPAELDKQWYLFIDCEIDNSMYLPDLNESFDYQGEEEHNKKETTLLKDVYYILSNDYNLSDWQFNVKLKNNVISAVYRKRLSDCSDYPVDSFSAIIPDYEDNEEIIIGVMDDNNYYAAREWTYVDKKGRSWKSILFNPKYQFCVNNDIVDKGYKYFVHASPYCYKRHIEIVGLEAFDTSEDRNHQFQYKHRVFFGVTNKNEIPKNPEYNKMMKAVADRYMKENPNRFFVVYFIKINELINDLKFYRDPNFDDAFFTEHDIPATFLKDFKTTRF